MGRFNPERTPPSSKRSIAIAARASRKSRWSTSTCIRVARLSSAWSKPRGRGLIRNRRNNPVHSKLHMHLSPRCRARTRTGTPCRSPGTNLHLVLRSCDVVRSVSNHPDVFRAACLVHCWFCFCHRATSIETASGVKESAIHALMWALGECARSDASPSRRRWAASPFAEALPAAESFRYPRSWAFTLLGLDAYCAAAAEDSAQTARVSVRVTP
jgi:hypothetical protein